MIIKPALFAAGTTRTPAPASLRHAGEKRISDQPTTPTGVRNGLYLGCIVDIAFELLDDELML